MSAKSSRPEPGWYVVRSSSDRWIVAVDKVQSFWVAVEGDMRIWDYTRHGEPEWRAFSVESLSNES